MSSAFNDLTHKDYERIRRLVYAKSGINFGDHKMQLVRARLRKRLRELCLASFHDYYNYVERDHTGEELVRLLDAITTNTTHLFREDRHFQFLSRTVRQWVEQKSWREKNSSLRIWSAGCSSGEEPHSIAMVADDALRDHPSVQLRILASDLSVGILSKAKAGLYDPHRIGTVPHKYRQRYFRVYDDNGKRMLQIVPELRRAIRFARFNLMTKTFPFRHGFHIIFCRNVMIYFDRPTQRALVHRFTDQLRPSGFLLIGHSESLNAIEHGLTYVEPTVYRKD